jgi:alpha-amylase/alpha-mannosidase (GH57 family)
MAEVALAFLWHQHQPYYPDDLAGQNPMPWVRLHGVKDYYGMAMHLLEVPEMHCTINLVPSLLRQLEAYTEGGATDRFLLASREPADGLSEAACLYLLDHFFMAHADYMIRPYPRYADLHQRRGPGKNASPDVLRRFGEKDWRDLQVWFNLTWIHPIAFEHDTELADFRKKGRHYSEAEKNWLLDKHIEILKTIIPLHRKLEERGQVELTTTPYYHPILPLLLDKKLAREALPGLKLPRYAGGYPDDAEAQVRGAVEEHQRIFGKPPRGMWPAEGSVCQSMLPLLGEHGIHWIATDEEILSCSTQGFVSRDNRGHVRNPSHMYRPYRVSEAGHELGIVFRDHALSDLIGFHYQRNDPVAAADDFTMRLRSIGQAVDGANPALVSVILDGENCWEHYPGGGVSFLRTLYQRCISARDIHPFSIGKFLETHPPRDTLPRLFAGSWINHNFAIWVGHEEDNTAWDALHRAREHLKQRSTEFGMPAGGICPPPDALPAGGPDTRMVDRIRRAWHEIYIAQGSDWYWWYGDDHSSAQDALFDYLFRKHLQNVYLLLGDPPPSDLARPISRRGQRPIHTLPRAFLDVKIDGRQTFFEWVSAGRYTCQNERGTMAMVTRGPMKDLYFGFDMESLLVRVDFDTPARLALVDYDALRFGFVDPPGCEVKIQHPAGALRALGAICRGAAADADGIEVGVDQIVELSIPFDFLGVKVNEPIQFFVELLAGDQSVDRAPREGAIQVLRPSPDFEQIMWDV